MSKLIAAAYWAERKEDSLACAKRAAGFIRRILLCSPLLSAWYYDGRSAQVEEWQKLDTSFRSLDELVACFERSRSGANAETTNPASGFHCGFWNGRSGESESSGISLGCGMFSRYLTNAVTLSIPTEMMGSEIDSPHIAPRSLATLKTIITALAEEWDPDWAGVFDLEKKKGTSPFLDRLLYVRSSQQYDNHIPAAPDVQSEMLGHGILYGVGLS